MSGRLKKLLEFHAADPKDPFCAYGIALEHAKAKRMEEAIDWLERTIEIDARYSYAYYQMAKLLAEKGDTAAARDVLRTGMAAAQASGDQHARSEMEGLLESLG